jgi:very-short-patch-repair endonuclease
MRGQSARDSIWKLIERQHGVVSRRQLLERGFTRRTIEGRITKGRLHPLWRGVYAVGRPRLTARGWWAGAVLACGGDAVLSHESAGELWGIRETNTRIEGERDRPKVIHVTVPADKSHRLIGIRVHRRLHLAQSDCTERERIRVTTPIRTLIDLAARLPRDALEACVSRADKLQLVDPERLRVEIDHHRDMEGVPALTRILDRRTFRLTDSKLERRFVKLCGRAKLPTPRTQQRIGGFRVDFLWPDLKLVVETDGLRYHRTASQQERDRVRDQALVSAGFIVLRFTHAQVTYHPMHVAETLRTVANGVSSDLPPNRGRTVRGSG